MKIKFKSEQHRANFAALCEANAVIVEFVGMNWWPIKKNRQSVDIVDPNGKMITVGLCNARIYQNERKYFNII